MTILPSTYHPISCAFHDLLEIRATTRKATQIRFLDSAGETQLRSAVITDVYSRAGAEFLSTSTGETLRLDQVLAVDGAERDDLPQPLQDEPRRFA
jgi:Rho-binding antiterminator